MLGDGARCHAEQDQRAGSKVGQRKLGHHAPRAFCQNLARASLAPIAAIGRNRKGFSPDHLTPDAAREAKAIATDAAQTGLIVVRRAEPGAGHGDDEIGISGGHRTFP